MNVYDQATKAVPASEKLSMYEIYIARAAEMFGVPKTRNIYEEAIQSGLPDKDVKTMCMKYAELEKSLGEIDRARAIYSYASQFSDPRTYPDFWNQWHEFEVQHGNEDTFREMLRIKRSVAASYSQVVSSCYPLCLVLNFFNYRYWQSKFFWLSVFNIPVRLCCTFIDILIIIMCFLISSSFPFSV